MITPNDNTFFDDSLTISSLQMQMKNPDLCRWYAQFFYHFCLIHFPSNKLKAWSLRKEKRISHYLFTLPKILKPRMCQFHQMAPTVITIKFIWTPLSDISLSWWLSAICYLLSSLFSPLKKLSVYRVLIFGQFIF